MHTIEGKVAEEQDKKKQQQQRESFDDHLKRGTADSADDWSIRTTHEQSKAKQIVWVAILLDVQESYGLGVEPIYRILSDLDLALWYSLPCGSRENSL